MSPQEITAIYLNRIAANKDWRMIETEVTESADERALVGDLLRISCHDKEDELVQRLSYRFYGEFYEHKTFGLQFNVKTFFQAQPHGRAGIVQYLQQAPWIGHEVARTLWEKFRDNAVRVLRETPDTAAAACGRHFTLDRAEEAAAWLRQEQKLEGCSIDLMDMLTGRGFPRATTKKALQLWGNRAAERIQQCPYRLMAFRGCGFKKTDKMYLDLGLPPDAIRRQAFCVWQALASDTDGHCWKSVHAIVSHLERNVSGCGLNPPKAAKLAKKMKLIATRRDRLSNLWFGESSRANAERNVAEFVAQWLDHNGELDWPDVSAIPGLSDHQREELGKALAGPLGLLTGSPGTGKTYSLAALVSMLPIGDVAVACPTGKAADRARQALAGYGCYPRVSTIHGLLGVQKSDIGEGWGFVHGPGKPLPFRYLIIDESSMTDIKLFASLCLAQAHGTHILLVGDPNQLPPVGPGAPLRDLIAAALPCGRLTEIRRNAGSIVEVCAAIRDDKPWQPDSKIDLESGKNLRLLECGNDDQQVVQMLRAITVARMSGFDPVWDVQVICALNIKGELSRKKLNSLLQAELNKSGEKRPGNPFKPNDKVVNTKNTFFKLHDPNNPKSEEEVFCCNGELGEVVEVQDKLTIIKVGGDKMIRVGIGKQKQSPEEEAEEAANEAENENNQRTDTGCTWDLGYALSCHKSQGSEWPVVIVMVDDAAKRVCSREWIYTAISRAKKLCILIGKRDTLNRFCRREVLSTRKTFLVEQIEEQKELMLAQVSLGTDEIPKELP